MILFFLLLTGFAASQDVCQAKVDSGTAKCSNASSLRFFHDHDTKRCLAFQFSGCGGNGNNFESVALCRQRCIPMDHITCPANTPATLNNKGTNNCGKGTGEPVCKDSTSFCHYGPNAIGLCCSKDSKEKSHQDHSKTCSNGAEKYQFEDGGHKKVLLGKSCSHNFCPAQFKCKWETSMRTAAKYNRSFF
ncbi:unnamed protein product [Caenorhabditis sp. 36 PRJEB53466]|nr:unnamed protein product [Caenorhabditis sp. 36 PRJEB53466]